MTVQSLISALFPFVTLSVTHKCQQAGGAAGLLSAGRVAEVMPVIYRPALFFSFVVVVGF